MSNYASPETAYDKPRVSRVWTLWGSDEKSQAVELDRYRPDRLSPATSDHINPKNGVWPAMETWTLWGSDEEVKRTKIVTVEMITAAMKTAT